jgi:small subunit ribosomal protein S17e
MLYKRSQEHCRIHTKTGELELGSIRPRYIKSAARSLLALYADTFTDDFETNKRQVEQTAEYDSKRIRNRIAGYIVTLIKIGHARAAAEAAEPGEEVTDMEM